MNLRFVFSLIVSLLSLLPAAAQDLTRNWIRERIFLDAEGKKCVTSVQYFDGIGRETLLLTDGLSPGGDVAGVLTGESFAGRTSAKWLPATGLTGFDFLTPERVKSLAVSSHEGDSVPFSLTRRDALGRVSSVRNAGGDLAGKAQLSDYTVNRAYAPVKRYCVDASGKLASRGMWREGALRGVLTSDEDGISTEVFSDLRGRKVLERRNGNNDTYFVYDDAGRLSFVLTPGMQEDSNLLKHAYEYRYDRRSECVYSRIPGCEPVEMHRDTAGRTAVVRDGVLRKKGRSRFILYDRLGSVRSVADEDGNVLQQNLYYARGGAWGDVCTASGFQSYKYCGKYLDRKHGLDLYDYGARLYDPAAAFWTSPDPLCEKYYNISPYAFCNNNPVTFIDPDGRDWYKDTDNTFQYDINIHSQKSLTNGQKYIGKSFSHKGASFRSDGSILYKNETMAYNRLWSQANNHYRTNIEKEGRETSAFILKDGEVLVMPEYKNDDSTSQIELYGYNVKGNVLTKHNEIFEIVGQIHTHQNRGLPSSPSYYLDSGYGDLRLSINMHGAPVFTIGHNGMIYGIRGKWNNIESEYNLYIMNLTPTQKSRRNLLLGKTKITEIIKHFKPLQ